MEDGKTTQDPSEPLQGAPEGTGGEAASRQPSSGMPERPAPAAIANPKADIAALDELERHLFAHRYAQVGISCYGPSIDPADATRDRGEALAILEEEDQALLCSPETGSLLERLSGMGHILSETQEAQVRILKRDRARLLDVPSEVQGRLTRLLAESDDVWRRAKASGDWASFEPYLDRVVDGMVKVAKLRRPELDPYDVWLDDFEHGSDRKLYDSFFSEVKDTVVPLFAEVRARGWQPSRTVVEGRFDERRQWELARDLMELEGLPASKMFLTSTEHPYSDALTSNYGIIASHVHEDDVVSNVYSMLHEGGHALYELGVEPSYSYTSLKGGTSSGMHEAQSRFFENYVGRDRAFAPHLLAAMAKHFRGQLGRVTPNQLYLACNRAEGSAIRTEADELTYPLHILIRYEIEQMLFSGECRAKDVPGIWNAKYKEYLGVDVRSDSEGALQDTHWADGLFGYFPTYALGGAIGAQLRHQMILEGMDWEGVLASGDLSPVREWLRSRIWRFGRSKDSGELIQDSCGEPFSARHYTSYLSEKFSDIYGLRG
ncbi:carboxypeptidase M32 [Olsenella urininfantis]|uniref:carboxypeptidase M32 n=1 Tax=Olsenella urininfantis TaxID=1871033 RepID=UPI000BE8BA4A|nr:carboxypeptidase M32 [Olsenella urininfantis]